MEGRVIFVSMALFPLSLWERGRVRGKDSTLYPLIPTFSPKGEKEL
jgi:hypothetical protein